MFYNIYFLWVEWGVPPFVLLFPQTVLASFCFLSLPEFLNEEAIFTATISLPPTHAFIPFQGSLPPAPFNWNHPLRHHHRPPPAKSSCSFLSLQSSYLLCWSGLCQPPPSRVRSPQFQPPNACVLESARPGLGHSPKLSFLICKMGLIKPIISVWPTHRQLPNCSPYFPFISHMSYCQFVILNFPVQKAPATSRDWKAPIPLPCTRSLHRQLDQAHMCSNSRNLQERFRTKQREKVPWTQTGLLLALI